MADLILYLAIVLVVVVVLLAIPRMRVANEETLAALHRQQAAHRQHDEEPIPTRPPDEERHAKQGSEQDAA